MEDITFSESVEDIKAEDVVGFFVGWNKHPSTEKHLELLTNSDYKIVARDGQKVVGFITAITDKTLAAYVPFLEVLPDYQHKGIGAELVKRMLEKLKDYYMVDLMCDPHLQDFYEKQGMQKAVGMIKRNYDRQTGIPNL